MKKLQTIICAGLFALSGCTEYACYDLPNEEKVCIKDNPLGMDTLTVTKTDGRVIHFCYFGTASEPQPDYVQIIDDKVTKIYRQPEILEEAKKQIIDYAKKARQDEVEEGLRKLR